MSKYSVMICCSEKDPALDVLVDGRYSGKTIGYVMGKHMDYFESIYEGNKPFQERYQSMWSDRLACRNSYLKERFKAAMKTDEKTIESMHWAEVNWQSRTDWFYYQVHNDVHTVGSKKNAKKSK